jgi:hypothetical protein
MRSSKVSRICTAGRDRVVDQRLGLRESDFRVGMAVGGRCYASSHPYNGIEHISNIAINPSTDWTYKEMET